MRWKCRMCMGDMLESVDVLGIFLGCKCLCVTCHVDFAWEDLHELSCESFVLINLLMANPSYSSHSSFTCPKCFLTCKTSGGFTRHNQTAHRDFTPISDDKNDEHGFITELHPFLNGMKSNVLYMALSHTSYFQAYPATREVNTCLCTHPLYLWRH